MYWVLLAIALGAIVAAGAIVIGLSKIRSHTPHRDEIVLGVTEGRLTPCPESPNCVSTQASPDDSAHWVEPIPYTEERDTIRRRIQGYLAQRPRTEIITAREDYIHAEVRSRIFRFIDDLELYFPEEQKQIHLRSASRVGEGDMGVNRKRYREIREVVEGR